MQATEELRNDHETLRTKLALLETLLFFPHGPGAPLQALVCSLSCILACHTAKEEFLLGILQERLHGTAMEAVRRLLDDHEGHASLLAALQELLANETGSPMGQAGACASQFIASLREHMTTEEDALFPIIDHSLGAQANEDATRLMREIVRCHGLEDTSPLASDREGAVMAEAG